MFDKLFGNLVNPSILLSVVRKSLEKSVGNKVNDFTICYDPLKKKIQFIIKGEVYNFADNKNIITLIEKKVKDKLKNNSFDYLTLDIINDEIKGTIYFQENNEKKFTNFNL